MRPASRPCRLRVLLSLPLLQGCGFTGIGVRGRVGLLGQDFGVSDGRGVRADSLRGRVENEQAWAVALDERSALLGDGVLDLPFFLRRQRAEASDRAGMLVEQREEVFGDAMEVNAAGLLHLATRGLARRFCSA